MNVICRLDTPNWSAENDAAYYGWLRRLLYCITVDGPQKPWHIAKGRETVTGGAVVILAYL